jgi:hypothetical protein
MMDELSNGSPEMPFAEGHESREALELGGPDKPLGKRIHIRTPGRQE